jgi:hypothetical protein
MVHEFRPKHPVKELDEEAERMSGIIGIPAFKNIIRSFAYWCYNKGKDNGKGNNDAE